MAEYDKPDEPRSRGGAAAVAALLLIVLMIGYPLSLGPVAWLVESSSVANNGDSVLLKGLEIFYMPAIYVIETESPLQQPYLSYLNLWIPSVAPTPVPPSAPLPYVAPPPAPASPYAATAAPPSDVPPPSVQPVQP